MPTSAPIVYVVDDDTSMARALNRLLTAAGYVAQTFASATEFLAQHRPEQRGCVVADLRMPVMGGFELHAALKRSGNPLPIVFLTGHGDIPTSVHAIKDGAEDFLTKPVAKDKLLAAVQRSLAADAAVSMQLAKRSVLQRNYELLSPREREVLAHITTGKLNKQIAAELGTTLRTIKAHRSSIIAKMQARSSAELGIMAVSVIPQKPLPAPGGNWSKVQ